MNLINYIFCLFVSFTQLTEIQTLGECREMVKGILWICEDPRDILKVKKVQILPRRFKRGKRFIVKGMGYLKEDIVDGTKAHLTVKFGPIKLFDKEVDFCQEITKVGLKCPMKKGYNKIKVKVELPKQMPFVFFVLF